MALFYGFFRLFPAISTSLKPLDTFDFARRGGEFGAAKRPEGGCCDKRAMSCNGLPLIAWRKGKFFVGQVEVRTRFLEEISDFFQIVAFGLPNGLFTSFYEPECRFQP